ncbi:MAG TPA: class I SAM-dependent methyltransferase [Thermoanaerobaculia bacterium]|nr:class I SAM-dependent methyltransferase [Thermoanaerobaculia bacterium]
MSVFRSCGLLACLFVLTPVAAGAQNERPRYQGREVAPVMSYLGADWLERPDRDREENTSLLLDLLPVAPGNTIADLGCGSGYFARRLASRVGPKGTVLCVDVQPEMLEIAERLSREEGVQNVRMVRAEASDPRLAEGGVDLILLVDVYHELQQPGPMLEHMRRALAPGGLVALVEYRAEGDTARHIRPEHRMSVEQVLREWLPAGFELEKQIDDLPTQHLFLFRAATKSTP